MSILTGKGFSLNFKIKYTSGGLGAVSHIAVTLMNKEHEEAKTEVSILTWITERKRTGERSIATGSSPFG